MLITEKLAENKSYRRIAEECGLNHVPLGRYHRNEVEPDGKTLAVLGKYFNVDFWELMENVRDSFRLTTTKTKIQERISIPDHLQKWFEDNRKDSGWIFTWKGDAPYKNLEKALQRAERETGIHMTPHLFRHASATLLYKLQFP